MIIKYNKENVAVVNASSGRSFTFIPGINPDVPNDLWDEFMKNKYFKADVDAGFYTIEGKEEAGPPLDDDDRGEGDAPIVPALARVQNSDDAMRFVKETYDINQLKELRKHETRRAVLDVIDGQIAKLKEQRRSLRQSRGQNEEGYE